MKVKVTSDNRALILRIMQEKLGQQAVYKPLPAFSYCVDVYEFKCTGLIEASADEVGLFPLLASLSLCEYPCVNVAPEVGDLFYPVTDDTAGTYLNLISIFSARQVLLNRALDEKGAFFVSKALMDDLLAHMPETRAEFLQALYGRTDEIKGIEFTMSGVALTGFQKCHPEEADIHRKLADKIIQDSSAKHWVKPFTPRVRNQKFAFRTWLYAIGMGGEKYADVRQTLLARLPGQSSHKKLTGRKEC